MKTIRIGKKPPLANKLKDSITVVERPGKRPLIQTNDGISSKSSAQVTHRQSLRISESYQSIELSYEVKLSCADTDDAINDTIARAERLVEEPMTEKFEQQRSFLKALARNSVK